MSDNDIYSAPEAALQETEEGSEFGSVEDGIAGNYSLELGATISEAWNRVKGAKGDLWLALILYMVVLGVLQIILTAVVTPLLGATIGAPVGQVLVTFVSAPLNAGFAILGIRRMANAPLRSTSIFDYFDKILPLFLCTLLMYVLIFIGFLLLVLPGIYLAVSYMFALTLIAEKDMKIWEALETSRKAVTHKWFTIFFTFLVLGLIVLVSMVPIMIGLIWTIPLSVLVFGAIYLKLFGIEKTSLQKD